MVDLIVELNAEGRINYVAPSTLKATGYALNEVLGKRGLGFIHAEDRPARPPGWRAWAKLTNRYGLNCAASEPMRARSGWKWRSIRF